MMDPEKYILVVDDEPLNLIIIGEYLGAAEEGYQWETAENGDQAWPMRIVVSPLVTST